MKNIKINEKIKVDLSRLIESKLLVQANSGGGKSWLLRRILEQSHGKVQQIVLDPEGEFSTLREKYDYILAGKDGDTPAEPRTAALLATRLLEMRVSAIIDLYELHPQERKHFVRLFLESMVNAPKKLWHPVMVVIDEAHVFAPEKGESEALNAVIGLASLGRKRGFGAILATQRISKLHKDAAAECNNKLIGRTGLDIDRKRAGEELGLTSKEEFLSLRSLTPGEFYAFGPAISNEVIKVEVGEVETSHPHAGSRAITRTAKPSAAIREALGKLKDLPEAAQKEARTISELKEENAQQRQEIGVLKRQKLEVDPDAIKKLTDKAYDLGVTAVETTMRREIEKERKARHDDLKKYERILEKVAELVRPVTGHGPEERINIDIPKFKATEKPSHYNVPLKLNHNEGFAEALNKEIGKGEMVVLAAIASHAYTGMTREHVTVATGYKASTRNTYIQRLQQRGYVQIRGDKIEVTQDGIQTLPADFKPLPSGDALRDFYMRTLPEGEGKIFTALCVSYPQPVSREWLSESTGYKPSTRNTYIQRLASREIIEFSGMGGITASHFLYD